MKKTLTEKQRQFVKKNYPKLTRDEIAQRLQVDKSAIDRYLVENTVAGQKKIVFTVILLFLPVLALLGLEIGLRLGRYGPNLDLVLVKEKAGQKYYALNPEVGKRYFSKGIAAVPELYEETFAYHKPKNGYRIFCLGGSTTASFPYELNARFHRLLQDRLVTLFPDKNIEVINVGLSAVNSFSVAEFASELTEYEPDLFLLYMGHNEFYGAFGVGSTQYLGQSRNVVRLYLWLQTFKTFQLLRNGIAALKGLFQSSQRPAAGQTLMEQMVREKYITFGSEEYHRATQYFRENLTEIIQTAKQHHIGILVSTLASNLKDQEPFQSLFSPATTSEARAQWEKFFQQGMELENQNDCGEALASYQQAKAVDSTPAKLHFHIGKCYEAMERYPEALAAFQQARDLDALRFRAAGELNEIIRQICRAENTPVVEMEQAFAEHSPNGVIGHELICEHLHPNFEGYFLMAKTFCAAMAENNFIAPKPDWNWQLDKTDEEYKDFSGVTALDLEIGAFKIERLTSHWPYQAPLLSRTDFSDERAASFIRQLTTAYTEKKIFWNDAHAQLANYYVAQKQYDRAEKEYRAVIKIVPENYYAYFKIGDLYLTQEKFAQAGAWLNQALERNRRSPFVFAKLATVYFSSRAYEKAVANFDTALALNKSSGELGAAEIGWAEYYKALSHLQLGQKKEGMEALAEVVRLQPANTQAKQLLTLLQTNADVHLQFTK